MANLGDFPLDVIGKVMSHLTSTTTVTDGVSTTRDDRSAFRQAIRAFRDARSLPRLLVDKYGADGALRHACRAPRTKRIEASLEATVRLLLAMPRGDAPLADADNSIALWHAAAHGGHEGIVKLLLEAPEHAARADAINSFALVAAAKAGHEGIVKLLLGAKEHAADNINLALFHAACVGHEGIVKLLLAAPRASIANDIIANNSIAMSLAAQGGHEGIVQLLLLHGAVEL